MVGFASNSLGLDSSFALMTDPKGAETLRGNVGPFRVAEILTMLGAGQHSGCLTVTAGVAESRLFVKGAYAIFASSTKPELKLGRLLVRQGRLKSAEVESLFGPGSVVGQDRAQRIGQMLVAEKLLNESEIGPLLEAQVREVFVDALAWKEGVFAFERGAEPPAGVVSVHIDLQAIVMEAVRRNDEFARLDEIFPDRGAFYRSRVNPEALRESVVLTVEEWQALFLLDGRRTLDELCLVVGERDPLQTLEVVRRLLQAGFIELHQPEPEESAPVLPRTLAFWSGDPAEAEIVVEAEKLDPPSPTPLPTPPRGFRAGLTEPIAPTVGASGHSLEEAPTLAAFASGGLRFTPWRLLIFEGRNEEPSVYTISKDVTTIGRHSANDIVFPANAVSGFHARIDRTERGIEIVDLKSLNGTVVNNLPALGQTLLADGDEVTIRPFRIKVRFDPTASAAVVPLPKLR